ncbi:uncharacterized protein [Ambystoma mexicanum]|uniref:uncharacterized protein n=1 Tax=Ambystoma mexicanum TaxID=8296 RepID=UPI0037E82531
MLTVQAEKGYKVDKAKLQYCQKEVLYIGQMICKDGRHIAPKVSHNDICHTLPNTVREMQRFLGFCNYCRAWVFDYSTYTRPLLTTLKEAQRGTKKLQWTTEMAEAFEELKLAMCTVPVLWTQD